MRMFAYWLGLDRRMDEWMDSHSDYSVDPKAVQ